MWDKLREMTGGDAVRMKLYLDTYKEALEENIPLFSEAIQAADGPQMRRIAHTLKPLFKIVGLEAQWELANSIETRIDQKNAPDGLESECTELLRSMEQSLSTLQ